MVASKVLPLCDASSLQKRTWTARQWWGVLVIGDAVVLFLTFSYALFLLLYGQHLMPIVTQYTLPRWSIVGFWELAGCLSWALGVTLVQPYGSLYALNYLRGVLAGYCSLAVMVVGWFAFLCTFFHGELVLCYVFVAPFALVAPLVFAVWRACYAQLLKIFMFRPQAVIVNTAPSINCLAGVLDGTDCFLPPVLGYVSEQVCDHATLAPSSFLGGQGALRQMIQMGLLDMIIVPSDIHLDVGLFQEVMAAATQGIEIFRYGEFHEYALGKVPLWSCCEDWAALFPCVRIKSFGYQCWLMMLDFCFGIIGAFVLIILLPLFSLCIYLDSPGPIFYWQERVGYRGRVFRLLKFRSMRIDAEQNGVMWATHMDARVTRVGRMLRATHLDELPQVLNILRGEMSLIGPRPERQPFVEQLEQTIPLFRCRLNVRPGLTGWAQVKIPYASTYQDATLKLQYDLYYIKYRSVLLDVCILLKTIVEMLWCAGR